MSPAAVLVRLAILLAAVWFVLTLLDGLTPPQPLIDAFTGGKIIVVPEPDQAEDGEEGGRPDPADKGGL